MKFNLIYILIGVVLLLMFIWMYRRQERFVRDLTTQSHAEKVYGLEAVEKPAFGADHRSPRDRFRAAVEKLRDRVADARAGISDAKLAAASEADRKFYIGYLREMADQMASDVEIPITGPMLVPLSAEVSRTLGNGKEDFMAGEDILNGLTEQPDFVAGREQGRADNTEGLNETMPGLMARFA